MPRAWIAAFLLGFACMAIELTAVRLLAPHFGDSAYVWTNVIGVILLALAIGAAVGGRIAERSGVGRAALHLAVAALLAASAPLLSPRLGPWLLPQDLPLDAAMPALVRGSLAATILLFGPAVFLLGAVSPALVVGAVRSGVPVGRAAGLVSAAGTIGSLVGTYAATHLLVPGLGSRATIWCAAFVLCFAAAVVRRGKAVLLSAVLTLGFACLPASPLRQPLGGQQLVAERESTHQFLQVVRTVGRDGDPSRLELKINEGLDSFHSLAVEGSQLTSGSGPVPNSYYDYHALAAVVFGDGRRPTGLRALSIGDAAGSIRRVYEGVHPGARVDGVELDPAVVALKRDWFPAPTGAGEVIAGLDGRVFVDRAKGTWHCMHVDAYSHQVYVPAHLASVEFFRAAHERLVPRGGIACNVGGLDARDPVVVAIARTMATVFADVAALRIPGSRNLLLLGRRDAAMDLGVFRDFAFGEERLTAADLETWRAVVAVAASSPWQRFERAEGRAVLVDDRPVLDRLLQESYFALHADNAVVSPRGTGAPEGAEVEAHAAYARGDFEGVLAAIGRSRASTSYLRYLAGKAQWARGYLGSADREFERSLAEGPAESFRSDLERERIALARELLPRQRAEEVSRRNAWLAASFALLLLGAAGVGYWMSRMPACRSVRVDIAAR